MYYIIGAYEKNFNVAHATIKFENRWISKKLTNLTKLIMLF